MFSRSWQTRLCSLYPLSGFRLDVVGWLVDWLIGRCYWMVVFSNNNYDFLMSDSCGTNAWEKLASRPAYRQQGSHPVWPKKVLLYTEGSNGVVSRGKVPLQRVVRETWPPRFSIQTYRTRSRSDIDLCSGMIGRAATFASICTKISFFWWLMLDGGFIKAYCQLVCVCRFVSVCVSFVFWF